MIIKITNFYYLVTSWDNQQTIIIGSSTNGSLITYLPVGSIYNCFKTIIQVKMTYNNSVINTYQINQNSFLWIILEKGTIITSNKVPYSYYFSKYLDSKKNCCFNQLFIFLQTN